MAAYSHDSSVHKTLSGTTADTVTITGNHESFEVINRGSGSIYFTFAPEGIGATTAVAEASGTTVVPPGAAVSTAAPGDRGTVVSVVGSGDAYSVQAVPQ